jgi:hypothetical protein
MAEITGTPVVHVRFDDHSEELSLTALRLNLAATDAEVKYAVACHLDRPVAELANHVIVRTDQAIIVRPEAIYG